MIVAPKRLILLVDPSLEANLLPNPAEISAPSKEATSTASSPSLPVRQTPESPEGSENEVSKIQRLYVTKGGYPHAEVDRAGYLLFDLINKKLNDQLAADTSVAKDEIDPASARLGKVRGYLVAKDETFRRPTTGQGREIELVLQTKSPALAIVRRKLTRAVPKDCEKHDSVLVQEELPQSLVAVILRVQITDLIPNPSRSLDTKIEAFVKRIVSESLRELRKSAESALKKSGYQG